MAIDPAAFIFAGSAYLLGSIPFGIIISKLFGAQDPRLAGSGNIGFTNVLRVSGKKVGIFTLIGDFGKGWVVGLAAASLYPQNPWGLIAVGAVVLGHIFPVFLKFYGGKGVATALGAVLGFRPLLGLLLIFIWLATVVFWKYSSGGAILSFFFFPFLGIIFREEWNFVVFSFFISSLILYKHKDNIKRLIQGRETKIGSQLPKKTLI